ncbi:hypothetical protein PENSPDRAFT_631875 [Peniophora sp. CONT]|nr:hypothetical protein PENSPDRAFT_631875 [Peniophora sp. CONT]
MINYAVAYAPEKVEVPATLEFRLPDETPISAALKDDGSIAVTLRGGEKPVATFVALERKLRVSLHGIVNEDRAEQLPVLELRPEAGELDTADVWASIYALWLQRAETDYLPLSLAAAPNALPYLIQTGLAYVPPNDTAYGGTDVLLLRASFWQGAGASPQLSWLRSPVPATPLPTFPSVPVFTRGTNVLALHPLRPPKPAPGTKMYSRFIAAVNQTLTFTHINAADPRHFETYCRWQNSDRVNVGWRERGDDEHHRQYLAERLQDRHIMGFMVEWDGELAGYGEMSWVKEDHMSTFVGGLGDFDQGTHLLVGEERFRGHTRFAAIMTSMKHMCFLRDPRTDVVVGEPRADLPIIPKLVKALPQEVNRTFDLPHKRAVYFVLRRQRFFEEGLFY